MSLSADLLCVDPKDVAKTWPLASGLIRSAIERTDLSDFEDIERDVLTGDLLLWLAISDRIEAAAVTRKSRNICTLVACAGHQRDRWLPLFAKIENYAKAEGCKCVRIYGRKGWERVLKNYRAEHVILERQL